MTRENIVDILGIGAQKSATSWAHFALNLHGKIWTPKEYALSGKEVRFWDLHYNKGIDWYREIMSPPKEGKRSMDVSPGYSKIGPEKIAECKETSPKARVFFLMRNPIYRDWSSLCMEAGREKLEIENTPFFPDIVKFYHEKRIPQHTTYVATLSKWREAYQRQLFVGIYDDFVHDPHQFYQRLCAHCWLNPDDVHDWRNKITREVFKGREIALPEQMRDFLVDKYEPMIHELEPLINRDLSDWLSPNPKFK